MASAGTAGGAPAGGAPAPPIAAPAPAPVEKWTENPNQGNFNPGTKLGSDIFKMKTKGLSDDKRLALDKKDSQIFKRLLEAKSPTFGQVVTHIPIQFALDGTATHHGNLLSNYSEISIDCLQRRALTRFGTAISEADPIPVARPWTKATLSPATVPADKDTFYKRVNANVVHEWLRNVLDEDAYAELLLEKEEFEFIDTATGDIVFDGIIMLFLALNKYDPSVVVGVECLRIKLETIRLHAYKNNVKELSKDFQRTVKDIRRLGGTCESTRRYLMTALMSGPNAKFNSYIDRINDDIEAKSGPYKDFTVESIMSAATTKYETMDRTGDWSKVDPRDAKLLALTTEASSLKEEVSSLKALGTQQHGGGGGSGGAKNAGSDSDLVGGVKKWRTIKKGDTMQKDNLTWWWCPKHVHPHGHFNGLYCLHKPADHDEWKAKFRKGRGKQEQSSETNKPDQSKKLLINQRLKEVLCTKLMLSDEDADNLCKEINQEN